MSTKCDNGISLRVTVPIATYRKPHAREYRETEIAPPPSTAYGLLLSLIGETSRYKYLDTQIAIAMFDIPIKSTMLRTIHRSEKGNPRGVGKNKRPDFQEILSDVDVVFFVKGKITELIKVALTEPEKINRFGVLSLGESDNMVNDLWLNPDISDKELYWLVPTDEGRYPMTIWSDWQNNAGTKWGQFDIVKTSKDNYKDNCWIEVCPKNCEPVVNGK